MTPSRLLGITRGTCHNCGKPTDDGLTQTFRMCSHRCCDEHESLRADLLATRRALKLAQAKALWYVCGQYNRTGSDERVVRLRNRLFRAGRLCGHYAAKFEREAER